MDEFIKMCDCPEIQSALREMMGVGEDWGDWCVTHNRPYFDHNDWPPYVFEGECKPIIRPLQEQLQEMMGSGRALLRKFYKWIKSGYGLEASLPYEPSIRELWLLFVMQMKFNKVWDGGWKQWIHQRPM